MYMNQWFFCFVSFYFSSSNRNNFFIATTVFIVEDLGEAITFINFFIFASFNCKSIQFQFLRKDLLFCFIFININLKDKSWKIYFGETLAVLECNLCQLSNVISKFWTFQVTSYSYVLPAVLKNRYQVAISKLRMALIPSTTCTK